MSKYFYIFFLAMVAVGFLFLLFASIFTGVGDPAQGVVYTIGAIIIVLLSFLIAQVFYLIDMMKKLR